MKMLGIIGGMGPMATVDLMRKIILATDASTDQEHIHILVDNNTSIPDRTQALRGNGPSPVPELLKSARRLKNGGAEALALACNTAYCFLPELLPQIDIPVIDMVEETAKAARKSGYQSVGLLATKGTCRTGIYRRACVREGIELVQPTEPEQDALQSMIYNGVKAGCPNFGTAAVRSAMDRMQARGAEAFILGCTEMPLAVEMYHLDGRFIDATQVLAERAVEIAGGKLAHPQEPGNANRLPQGKG